jgi:hypothetical protein
MLRKIMVLMLDYHFFTLAFFFYIILPLNFFVYFDLIILQCELDDLLHLR